MDDELYVLLQFHEDNIRHLEDMLLSVLKEKHHHFPTEKNNQAWLDFSDFVIERRDPNKEK